MTVMDHVLVLSAIVAVVTVVLAVWGITAIDAALVKRGRAHARMHQLCQQENWRTDLYPRR